MKPETDQIIKRTGFIQRLLPHAVRIAAVILMFCIAYGGFTHKKIADNIVRLHIIANSDNEADQDLKFKVRDAIIAHMQEKYPGDASRDDVEKYLQNSLGEIRRITEDVLRDNGSSSEATVRYGEFPFPTRAYGNITLPAGVYKSVRVELGNAKGQNWWCVMFPPLCIADDNTMRMSEESREQLKETLGEEGYRLITDVSDANNKEVQVKFRIVEWVQNSRLRLAELISRLF
ncbi:MAG: stage II sporulation protein R [Clostridiaceae bacterium]|jgi:stage II sporulation protein R|nr:stage II sporulation protein R [Clostridiaceae bacterium]